MAGLSFGRRSFIGGIGATGLAALTRNAAAQASKPPKSGSHAAGKLPPRGNFVIRDAYVMTMDAGLGDIPRGDLHVRDGAIVAVGTKLQAPGATRIDGKGMIVLPGLVETHWHMWSALTRGLSGDKPEAAYFRASVELGKAYEVDDMYTGALLAAAEALHGGITYVHDWCHNVRGPDYARADLRALADAGVRGRFSYAHAMGMPSGQPVDLADIERLHGDWDKFSNGGMLSLGLGWRGTRLFGTARPPEVAHGEFDTARRLGLPITAHVNIYRGKSEGEIADLAKQNMLGKDVQLVHATHVTPEEIKAVAESGASVSFSPFTELRIGFGIAPTGDFLAAGVPVGLSVDTTALSGNADMFGIMKVIENMEDGKTENEFKLPARRVLELATIEGARSMGMDDRIGSLKPGKRADLIMVSTQALDIAPLTDAAHLIVEAAQPANVDTVVVDGRILKRKGRLTALDTRQIIADAAASLVGIRKRANWA
jgi:cytosine/adenosine deaminase-related metal-dependent hydrolase